MVAPSVAMDLVGSILGGKYAIRALAGKGGMGTVYEAEHLDLGRVVAVKVLPAELAESPESRARFEREVKAAGRIEHANICEVFDCGVDERGLPYSVMPLLKGEPLSAAIARSGPFPIARALDIAEQILAGLGAAHEAGVVHRDLKPANVFLTCLADREDFVKILDFGISKPIRDEAAEGEVAITKSGAVLGTPAYMAPEQARGAKDLDQRVDVYGVGVSFYEMLTGARAVRGESYNEVLWNIWNAPIKPIRGWRRDVPAELERVVLKAMRRDRAARFESAAELGEALRRAAPGAPTGAALDTIDTIGTQAARPPQVSSGWRGGRRLLGLGVAAVALVGAVSAAVGVVRGREPRRETRTTTPGAARPPSSPRGAVAAGRSELFEPSEVPPDGGGSGAALRLVRITLRGVPPESAITVDGRVVSGPTFEVPASGVAARLEVRAAGHDAWTRDIAVVDSTEVQVELRPRRASKRPPTTRPEAAPAAAPDRAPSKALEGTVPAFGGMP